MLAAGPFGPRSALAVKCGRAYFGRTSRSSRSPIRQCPVVRIEPTLVTNAPGPVLRELGVKVARNTASNAVGRIWVLAVNFALTPYVVSKLGDERFGIWAFLTIVVGYFAVFDLGLGVALVKYVAEFRAAGQYKLLNAAVNSAFTVMAVLVGLMSVIGLVASAPLLHLFKILPQNYLEARFALIGALLILIGQGLLAVFQSVLNGCQRMDWFNFVAIITSIPNAAGVIFFLHYGYGLRGLTVNNAITFVLGAVLTVGFVRRVCPEYQFKPFRVDRVMLKKLLNFGGQMQLTNLGALMCWQGDKVLIAGFLNMSLVTAYELGYRVAMTARTIPGFLFPALMPAVAEAHAQGDASVIQLLFDLGSRYLALATFPVLVFFICDAPLIMRAWMGGFRPEAVWAARMLLIGFLVNLLGGVGTSIARGVGRPDIETRLILPYLVLNFGSGIPLIMKLGFWGPLIATPFSTIATTAYLFYQLHRRLHLKLGPFLKEGLSAPGMGALLAAAAVVGVHLVRPASGLETSRLPLVAHLAVDGAVFCACYLVFIWRVRLHEVHDWILVKEGVHLVFSRFFRAN
jgi:O-antigen/teichoic acid export membrane protein